MLGTKKNSKVPFDFEVEKLTIELKNNKTKTLTNSMFVNEKSKQNNLIVQREIIWNCSNGVNNIFSFCNELNVFLSFQLQVLKL